MNTNQSFKLSIQGKIASAVSMALVVPFISSTALANNVTTLGQTSAHTSRGVDVVNIVNPNSQGLSHNKYNDFNVSKSGLVLNNSVESGQSQLAGYLSKNRNLNESASVILNEVVSKNPSLLLGQQEVFGMAADLILANPNGITGKDIGFINTNRAALVVGAPNIDEERLAGFHVGDNQSNKLFIDGDIDNIKRLDLIAPTIDVDGNITASDEINLISGRNDVDYDTLAVTKMSQNQGEDSHQDITLDGSVLGSMKSGRIRVHNTDAGATQLLQGHFEAENDLTATADNLLVKQSELNAGAVSLTGESTLQVGGKVSSNRYHTPEHTKRLSNWVKETTTGDSQQESFHGTTIRGGSIDMAGGDIAVKGSHVEGQIITAVGNNIDVGGVVTTNKATNKVRHTKGLWFNETTTQEQNQKFHDSSLLSSEGLSLTSHGDLTLSGTTLQGGNVELTAGDNLTANSLTTENSQSSFNSYKNETAKLKTGEKIISQTSQVNNLTTIDGDFVSLNSGGDQRLEGVQFAAENAELHSGKDLTIGSSKASNQTTNDENFLYWGGIGGGETNIDNEHQENLSTSSITAHNISLKSDGDLDIASTRVTAASDLHVVAAGDVNVTHELENGGAYFEARHGTAFNITDLKSAVDNKKQTIQSSDLSGNNVKIIGNNIDITGSDVTASGTLLAKAANELSTDIANATNVTTTEDFDIRHVNSTEVTGNLFGCNQCGDEVDLEEFSFQASSGLKGVTTITAQGSGSVHGVDLSSNSAHLVAQEVDLKGTHVSGTEGVDIVGNQVSTATGEGLVHIDNKLVKSTGPEIYVKGGLTGIEFGIGLGHDQIINEHHAYDAVESSITSQQDVNVIADGTLTNTGTQINAANVNLHATDIVQNAGHDRIVDRDVIAGGDAALRLFANISPIVGASVGLSGQGIGRVTENKTAVATNIHADNAIKIKASNSASDVGTNMNAHSINITADDYASTSAYDSEIITSHSGSGSLSVSATTSDFQSMTVGLTGKGAYQYREIGDATAVQGNVSGNKVVIYADDKADVANNFEADKLIIHGGNEAIISQNDDKQWDKSSGGFFGAFGGVSFSPGSCCGGMSPAISAEGGFNFSNVESTQAKTTLVNAGQFTLHGNKLAQVAGTNIQGGQAVIKGDQANILAAQDFRTAKGASFSAEGGYAGSIIAGADLAVVKESSNKATSTNIDVEGLKVLADGSGDALVVEGAKINADSVFLYNGNADGNVAIKGAKSKDKVGNFYLGANIGLAGSSKGGGGSACGSCGGSGCGSCGGMGYIPTSIGAQLIVKTDDSSYHELGSINGGNVTIESGKDIGIQGSVNSNTLHLDAGNDVVISSVQDNINKVFINQGISLGLDSLELKDDISSEELINTVDDGTDIDILVDVNLAGKSNLYVDKQKVTQQTKVNTINLKGFIGNNLIVNAAQLKASENSIEGGVLHTSNNDDYVHIYDAKSEFDLMNLLKMGKHSTPEDWKKVLNLEFGYAWDDHDGDNTQAIVEL